MDNVSEVVALLRQQAVLENQILTTGGPAVAAEWALATTRRPARGQSRSARRRPSYGTRSETLTRHRLGPGCHRVWWVQLGRSIACARGLRHFMLDSEGTLSHLPMSALDRMLHNPTRHRLARFARPAGAQRRGRQGGSATGLTTHQDCWWKMARPTSVAVL